MVTLTKEVLQEIVHQTKLVLRLLDFRNFLSMVSDHFSSGSQDRVLGREKKNKNWMFNFPEISCVYYCKTVIY